MLEIFKWNLYLNVHKFSEKIKSKSNVWCNFFLGPESLSPFFLSTNQIEMQLDLHQSTFYTRINEKRDKNSAFIIGMGRKMETHNGILSIPFVLANIKWSNHLLHKCQTWNRKKKRKKMPSTHTEYFTLIGSFTYSPFTAALHRFIHFCLLPTTLLNIIIGVHTLFVCRSCKLVWSKCCRYFHSSFSKRQNKIY